MRAISFACPSCRGVLERCAEGWICPAEELAFGRTDGIPDFILPARREAVEAFLARYRRVRGLEGWGSVSAAYYEGLPYRDTTGRHARIWEIRARTFDCFLDHLGRDSSIRRLLDIGAGNGWLSARLAERGYRMAALDVNLDLQDGLGALGGAAAKLVTSVRAEFDALPFAEGTFDGAVFNASIHYASDVMRTLAGALRAVRPGGMVYILDSPLYHEAGSGRQMVQERERRFAEEFKIAPSEERGAGFLTFAEVERMAALGPVEAIAPHYGWRWKMRPLAARVLGRREPAAFRIIIVKRAQR